MELKQYDAVRILMGNCYAVRKGYKWGLLDNNHQLLLRIVYDYVSEENGDLWVRYHGYKFYVKLEDLPMRYDCIFEFVEYVPNTKLAKIALNGKFGVINQNYNEIVPCVYDKVTEMFSLLWGEKISDSKSSFAVYSIDGGLKSDCIYEGFGYPILKRLVCGETSYAIIDKQSQTILDTNIKSIKSFRFSRWSKEYFHSFSWDLYDIEKDNGFHFIYSVEKGIIDKGYLIIEEHNVNNKKFVYAQRFLSYPHYNDNVTKELWELEYQSQIITDVYYEDNFLLSFNSDECTLLTQIHADLFIYKSVQNEKHGLIDKKGYIIPSIYDELFLDDRLHIVVGIRNSQFGEVFKPPYFDHSRKTQIYEKNIKRISGIVDVYHENGRILMHEINYIEWSSAKKYYGILGYLRVDMDESIYIFKDGHLIIPPHLYDEIDSFLNDYGSRYCGSSGPYTDAGYALVRKGDKWGVVNSNGELLIPIEFDEISGFLRTKEAVDKNTYYKNKFLKAKRGRRNYFFEANKTLKKVDDDIINDILDYYRSNSHYSRYDENELLDKISKDVIEDIIKKKEIESKWYRVVWDNQDVNCVTVKDIKSQKIGLIDAKENRLCDFIFDSISEFNEDGIAIAKITGEGYGLINKAGEIILPCKYDNINMLEYGYILIGLKGKVGIIDNDGHVVVPCIYPKFESFNLGCQTDLLRQGYILVENNSRLGLVNFKNSEDYTLNCKYKKIEIHSNYKYIYLCALYEPTNYIVALGEGYCEIICLNSGNIVKSIINPNIIDVCIIVDEYIVLELSENDNTFYRIISLIREDLIVDYTDIRKLNNHYLQIARNGKWGLYDFSQCREIISCDYETVDFPSNGYSIIKENGKYGFVNMQNQRVVNCVYTEALPFKNGIAAVRVDDTWGYIDEQKKIIAYGFEDAQSFSDGLAAVKKGGKWGYIDIHGKVVIPFRFEEARRFSDGLAAVAFKVNYGYIDKKNKTIIPFQFRFAFPFEEGVAEVRYKNGEGTISKDGFYITTRDYRTDYYYDDYERNTWDAMTDGMYGDMPDSFDGDYSFMGY